MEAWIPDQLCVGLSELLAALTGRFRRIASRLVDAKAGTLAGRIDGIPARVLELPQRDRADALISELGKLVLIARDWGNETSPTPVARRVILGAENRDVLLENNDALRHSDLWEVLVSRDETRCDGLIARSTWLLGLDDSSPRFALLQDFFRRPRASRGRPLMACQQFKAELVLYPAPTTLRAQIVERSVVNEHQPWPITPKSPDILRGFTEALIHEPWITELPIFLPSGRLGKKARCAFLDRHKYNLAPSFRRDIRLGFGCRTAITGRAVELERRRFARIRHQFCQVLFRCLRIGSAGLKPPNCVG